MYGIVCAPDLVARVERDEQGRIVLGLAMDEITAQCQGLLVVSAAGEWKASPTVGASAMRFLRDDDPQAFIAAVCSQLRADGQRVVSVKYDGELKIDASYEG